MKNLPKDWKYVKLGDVLTMAQYGLSMSSSDQGQYPMFRMNNFRDGKAVADNMVYVDLADKEAGKFLLQRNDILFNRTNSPALVGKTGLFDLDGDYVFASYLVRLRVNEAVADPRFVNYFLNDDKTKQQLKALSTVGVSQSNINPTTLRKKLMLPLPPKPEQQRIVTILDACDRAIDGTAKLLEKQEKRKKALTNELLHLNSLAIPIGWAMHEVGDFVSALESGVSVNSTEDEKQGSSKRILKTSAVFNGEFYPAKNKIITKADEQRAKLNPKANAIIISRMNTVELVGQSGYVAESYADIFLPDRLWQTVFRDEYAQSVKWLSYYLSSDRVRASIRNAASGTSGSMKNIAQESFLKIPVLTPPVEKQHTIARVLETADKEIKLLRQQHKLLQQQKKGLMQRLLTGQAFTH